MAPERADDQTRLDDLERMINGLTIEAASHRLLPETTSGGEVIVRDLLAIASRRAQSDAPTAHHALDVGDRLAVDVGCADALPQSMYVRARLVLNNGGPDEALALIADARAAWLALDRPLDAYRTDLGRMHVLDDLGRHGEAVTVAGDLLEELGRLDRTELEPDAVDQLRWIMAAANENLGVACGFTGQHRRALEAYEVAEAGYLEIGGSDDMARCRANRGVELVAIGRAVEGLEVLQSAASMFDELDDRLSYAQCLGHVADAELLLGLYAAALTRYERARTLLDDLEARTEACRIRLRTIRAYLALNLVDEAEVLATQTELALQELSLRHDLAEARWLGGVATLRAGRAEAALGWLESAAEGAIDSDDPPLLVKVLLARSEALEAVEDHAGALEAARQALTVVQEDSWPTEELHVRLRLAQLLHDVESVDSHLRRAERLADDLGLPHLRYPVLLELGRHRRRQGIDAEARRRLREAVDVVEGLRGLIPDEAVRTSYLEGRTAAHVDLMSMLIDAGGAEDAAAAFDLAEASKSRTLADILAGVVQPGDRSVEGPSQSALRRYEADLHAAYSALVGGGPTMAGARRRAVHDRAIELERAIRLAHLQATTDPGRSGVADAESAIVRPAVGEQVIAYHVVGDRIVAFVWVGGELDVVFLDRSVEEVAELVAQWERARRRFEIADHLGSGGAEQLVANATDVLGHLWTAIVAPLAPLLDPEDDDLLIIPHGPLHGVPFHALVGPDGPVAADRTITLAPSYSVAARLRSTEPFERAGRSLVVGVPDESAPAVAAEAAHVAAVLPGAELLLGDEATIANLSAGTGSPLDVLHLACHGLHRARNPMFSALKLADGWLTATDVLGLRLQGTLVVLSACETGRHSGSGSQDESIGLARSFLAAGARAVVVSLWLADDKVTELLMDAFYRELEAGRSPAAALRAAQLLVARDHSHPAAWAPFVIQAAGKGET